VSMHMQSVCVYSAGHHMAGLVLSDQRFWRVGTQHGGKTQVEKLTLRLN